VHLRYAPEVAAAYESLDKAGSGALLDAIDDALDQLEADPGSAAARRRAFAGGAWGITVRTRDDDWLVIWEPDPSEDDVIRVRYLGPDPFPG
jgi:hypothetical protein